MIASGKVTEGLAEWLCSTSYDDLPLEARGKALDVVFDSVGGMVACYKGFYAKGGPKGVGDAVNQAVVITFLLLFFLNFILTAVYFNFVPQKL